MIIPAPILHRGRFATFDSCHGWEVYTEATRFISSDVDKKEKTVRYRALFFLLEVSIFCNVIAIICYIL